MKFVSNLKTSAKVLILVSFTLILILFSALFINIFENETTFEEYDYIARDKNVEVSVVLTEKRTHSDSSKTDSKEIAKWDARVTLVSLDSSAEYRNVFTYLSIESASGKLFYSENKPTYNKEVKLSSTYHHTASSLMTLQETKNNTTKEFELNDNSPEKGYVKVVYEKKIVKTDKTEEWIKNELSYKFDILKSEKEDFSKYEKTNVELNKDKFEIDLKDDQTKLYTMSIEKKVDDDKYTNFNINLNYDKTEVGKKGMNIVDSSIVVFAKVDNDQNDEDNLISDYIQLLQVYGIFRQSQSGTNMTSNVIGKIAQEYNVSELYFLITSIQENGIKIQSRVKINVSDLNLPE